jgi:hypothetical protein
MPKVRRDAADQDGRTNGLGRTTYQLSWLPCPDNTRAKARAIYNSSFTGTT